MINKKSLVAGAVVVALFSSGAVHAGTVTDPSLGGVVTVSSGSTTNTWTMPSSYTTNPDGTFTYASSYSNANWGFVWDITVNPDPLISASLGITNTTSSTKHFDLVFTLPVGTPFPSPALKSGSLGASFQDLNGSGAASLTNITWAGRIDGVDVMSLIAADISCGGINCSGNLFPVSDGPLASGGVSSNIGLHLAFDLSAGDKANFTTSFEVTPVPLPAAVWLLGSGLLGLAGVARRRRVH